MADRRSSGRRIPFRRQIKYGLSKPTFIGYTFNLSQNGIGVSANRLLPMGSRIMVEIYMEDEVIGIEGIVVWVNPILPGIISKMAVKFTNPNGDVKRIYQRIINQGEMA